MERRAWAAPRRSHIRPFRRAVVSPPPRLATLAFGAPHIHTFLPFRQRTVRVRRGSGTRCFLLLAPIVRTCNLGLLLTYCAPHPLPLLPSPTRSSCHDPQTTSHLNYTRAPLLCRVHALPSPVMPRHDPQSMIPLSLPPVASRSVMGVLPSMLLLPIASHCSSLIYLQAR